MLTAAAAAASTTTPPLEWSVWLLRDRPNQLAGIIIALAMIVLCAWYSFHSIVVALAACAATLSVVKEYVAPLRFTLDSGGVRVKCAGVTWIEMPWTQIQSIYRTNAGLKLSPYARPRSARAEDLRGVTLRFPRNMTQIVEHYVARYAALSLEALK